MKSRSDVRSRPWIALLGTGLILLAGAGTVYSWGRAPTPPTPTDPNSVARLLRAPSHAATGAVRWQRQGPWHIDTSPAVEDGLVYVGSGLSRRRDRLGCLCLEARTGSVLWEEPTALPVWGSPAADGGQVFFGLGNGRLDRSAQPPDRPAGAVLCVEAATGQSLWRCRVPDAVLARPAVDSARVYFGARDGHAYC